MPSALTRTLRLLPLLFLLTACTAHRHTMGDPESPYSPPRPPKVGDILHLPTGLYVTEEQMLRAAVDARIVYLGETHDNPASHRQELLLLQALDRHYPGKVALGMEMFTPAQQQTLDAWTAGKLTEKEFLKQSRWYDVWRMDFDYYRELLSFARDRKIPVIGLNAQKDLVKALGQWNIAELPPELRERVPEMDMADPYQRAMTEAIFADHSHGGGQVEGFHRVQTLWDETMAENIARFLRVHPDTHMLVVAGGNHVRYGFGIPRRVFRRLPDSYVLVGSHEIEIPEDKKDRLMDVEQPPFPMPPYHFVAYSRYEDLGKENVALGVMLTDKDGSVAVEGVLPGSAAEKAGVRKEDIILSLDGEPVTESFDVVYAVKQKKPGDRGKLNLRRGGEEVALEVTFTAPPAGPHGR